MPIHTLEDTKVFFLDQSSNCEAAWGKKPISIARVQPIFLRVNTGKIATYYEGKKSGAWTVSAAATPPPPPPPPTNRWCGRWWLVVLCSSSENGKNNQKARLNSAWLRVGHHW